MLTKRWEQGSEKKETITTIKEIYVEIHVLSEEKQQLVPVLSGGILEKWISNKFSISYSQEWNDTLRIVMWDVSFKLMNQTLQITQFTYFFTIRNLVKARKVNCTIKVEEITKKWIMSFKQRHRRKKCKAAQKKQRCQFQKIFAPKSKIFSSFTTG